MNYQVAVDIKLYLEDRALALAETSRKSREAQLLSLAQVLSSGEPLALWHELERRGLKPYSRATVWSWVSSFWGFRIEQGRVPAPNVYALFRRKNAKQFKHVYQPKLPDVDALEAAKRIESLRPESQRKAIELLTGGLRYAESFTYDGEQVIGKGGKPRKVYPVQLEGAPAFNISYRTFLRDLKSVGLTPHMLRKIMATHMALNSDLSEADFLKLMGWESMNTAKVYLAPRREAEQELAVREAQARMELAKGVTRK